MLGNRVYVIGGTTQNTQIITDEGSSFTVTNGARLPKKMNGFSFTYGGNIFFIGHKWGELMKMGSDGWTYEKVIDEGPRRAALVVTPDILFPQH